MAVPSDIPAIPLLGMFLRITNRKLCHLERSGEIWLWEGERSPTKHQSRIFLQSPVGTHALRAFPNAG